MAAFLPLLGGFFSSAAPFISAGLGAFSAIKQGTAQRAQASANSQAAARNAEISQRNAELTAQQTQTQLDTADRQQRLQRGANIAAMGASGISGGSSLDITSDNLTQQTLDILNIEREGILRKQNFEIQGANQIAESQNFQNQSPGAASIALSGVSSALSGYTGAGGSF